MEAREHCGRSQQAGCPRERAGETRRHSGPHPHSVALGPGVGQHGCGDHMGSNTCRSPPTPGPTVPRPVGVWLGNCRSPQAWVSPPGPCTHEPQGRRLHSMHPACAWQCGNAGNECGGPAPAHSLPCQPGGASSPLLPLFRVRQALSGLTDGRSGFPCQWAGLRLVSWLTSPQPHWGGCAGLTQAPFSRGSVASWLPWRPAWPFGPRLILSLGLSSWPSHPQAGRP